MSHILDQGLLDWVSVGRAQESNKAWKCAREREREDWTTALPPRKGTGVGIHACECSGAHVVCKVFPLPWFEKTASSAGTEITGGF